MGRKEVGFSSRHLYVVLTHTHRRRYNELKSEWCGVKEVFERADIVEERHRIDVDCRRTDRSHPIFAAASTPTEEEPNPTSDVDVDAKRYSTMSPNFTDIGAQSPSNEHIERLAAILLTYNFYEKELGMYLLLFSTWVDLTRRHGRICPGHV